MNQRPDSGHEKARAIKMVVFDVDGVLTDGTLSYAADGEQVKHFNVKDGVGIKLLQTYDIATAIISAKDSAPLAKRARDLGIRHFFPGSKDKWAVLSELMTQLNMDAAEVCYVGDDVIDLKVMKRVGFAVAPADAFWMVKNHADMITTAEGGKGVAREVADVILGSRMALEEAYIQAMLPEFETLPEFKDTKK
ncbi:MAG: 3-deoxy-manno-octulosonate-8-phosphatase [Oceanospirillaceae bacterium]|nr:3-deoxy-manno-octulosonate-8-phosphatase [Oceanospirillaceae bacterium]|tara:strand:- start:42085 stop:42663 length:579 start_codon:yes stop_codon:yes gene_type:complete